MSEQLTQSYPVLPLRDVVVYPHMVIPLFVGREKSIRALETAMTDDKKILLVAKKNAEVDDPQTEDIHRIGIVRNAVGDGIRLMVDANQAWDRETAVDAVRRLAGQPLRWIEEPLPVDADADSWAAVASAASAPLAGGENMRSDTEFDAAIAGDEVDLDARRMSTTAASGENRTTPIEHLKRVDGAVVFHGYEMGRAFSWVIDEQTGYVTAAIAADGMAVSVFGACTPMPHSEREVGR